MQGTTIGVLMSATLPARLGEPSRALIVARRLGRPRDRLPAVLGTLVSQTLLNVLALVILGAVMFTTVGLFAGRQQALLWYALAPFARAAARCSSRPRCCAPGCPRARRGCTAGWPRRARRSRACARACACSARRGSGLEAVAMQLGAWALQWVSCYVLLVALGLDLDMGAAAAVLFAVNVTAVLPLTPSNLGVFQAACLAVLTGAYGVDPAQALGYGIILQAVEIATAVDHGRARAGEGGPVLARGAPARAPHRARLARPRAARSQGLKASGFSRKFLRISALARLCADSPPQPSSPCSPSPPRPPLKRRTRTAAT